MMCEQRDIAFISYSERTDSSKHLNESKVLLNPNGMKVFAERLSAFLKKIQLIMTTKISSPMSMKLNSSL